MPKKSPTTKGTMLIFDFCVVALTLLSTFGVLLGFAAYYADRETRRAAIGHAWKPWAERRGFRFVEAEGEWPNRASPRVEGRLPWGDFHLEIAQRGERVSTRLVAWPHDALCARLVCCTERDAEPARIAQEKTGFVSFDAEFATAAAPRGTASRLVGPDLARALQAFALGGRLRFEYDRGHVALVWPGEEESYARIEEALRVVSLAADRVERIFRKAA
jgi:hypothetical protein